MEPIMGADLYSNRSDGFVEGTTPDGSLHPQCYFNNNNSFASQTLNDVKWDNLAYGMFPQPTACIGFQTMST
ncbi:hypothetical protein FRX31_018286 [Thalictrum thalictroides]|uniref:Uncharacterized protein n=1 Tax=Thalictrum thalictroides TaxID=46969 RepID=A0A7J6W5A8_THATH|nr:hypothetical protein FRX31_018286 [Thalictrum thalictroides]